MKQKHLLKPPQTMVHLIIKATMYLFFILFFFLLCFHWGKSSTGMHCFFFPLFACMSFVFTCVFWDGQQFVACSIFSLRIYIYTHTYAHIKHKNIGRWWRPIQSSKHHLKSSHGRVDTENTVALERLRETFLYMNELCSKSHFISWNSWFSSNIAVRNNLLRTKKKQMVRGN